MLAILSKLKHPSKFDKINMASTVRPFMNLAWMFSASNLLSCMPTSSVGFWDSALSLLHIEDVGVRSCRAMSSLPKVKLSTPKEYQEIS